MTGHRPEPPPAPKLAHTNLFAIGFLWAWLYWPALVEALDVVDDLGFPVHLAEPARRIIALAPHAAELVSSAGAGDRLVGRVLHSDFPPFVGLLPAVGDATHIDREAVLALDPDLVVAWPTGNRPTDLEWLRGLGIAVYLSDPPNLQAIAENIEEIGRLGGANEISYLNAKEYRARLAALQRQGRRVPPLRVFYELWPQPLMSVDRRHIIGQLLALCGGESLFPELPGGAARIDLEAVIAADPQAIIVAHDGRPGTTDEVNTWHRWSSLSAVRSGTLFSVPADLAHRPGPRILDAAVEICRGLSEAPDARARLLP